MMQHTLPQLPYGLSALEPHISAQTLSFHHGKHHQAYVTNLNALLQHHPLASLSLEELILQSAKQPDLIGIFNNAAQVWNHTFYWNCMKPNGGGMPSEELLRGIEHAFGSFATFAAEFCQAAITQFGSGWAWLVSDKEGQLSLMKTGNADTPMVYGKKALLTCDVWEHAYYLDYQNRRSDYVNIFMKHLVNWDFVFSQYLL